MFCIAAFIVLAILSIFSASHRRLAKSAWHCVSRRVTFRPCDTSFKDELKAKLLANTAVKRPRLTKYLDAAIEVLAVVFVVLTIWSLLVVIKSGLNLFVYGTCSPRNAEACSLGSEACSIESARPSFWTTVKQGKPHSWVATEVSDFAKTVSNIPTRLQKWEATAYLPENASYYNKLDITKPTAVEVIDPGCQFCAQLFRNIKEADFHNRYNLTYVAYPIKDSSQSNGYKFANSELVVRYLEAIKKSPLESSDVPSDWRILERIFTESDDKKVAYQIKINGLLNNESTEKLLQDWLKEFGYDDEQIDAIKLSAHSDEISQIIERNRDLVDNKIKTVKIPTIIFDGRRHDGALAPDALR